ncbi:unnamed protein product [Darwinula stevensoni]|uniref:Uncharacterized protein n=1 Tax=Darwinula stevensoni TaxID=69355 RepID=A0A7R8X569_9CRUS|nr:unnamed protein product [Darwinula stevensoni]CAG0884353.1 unnamed protein product [Darwinula stevensoni]
MGRKRNVDVQQVPRRIRTKQGGNANEYVDELLENARQWLIDNGYNNLQLPDADAEFSQEIFPGFELSGSAGFRSGSLQGLETILRSGDATLDTDGSLITISTGLGFQAVGGGYEAFLEFEGIEISTDVGLRINDIDIFLQASVDPATLAVTINQFNINDLGDIEVDLTGLGPLDWALGELVSFLKDLLGNILYDLLEDPILDALTQALGNIIPPTF